MSEENDIELIKHAAIVAQDGMIILGKCHADCFHTLKHIGDRFSNKVEHQGFFTSHGRYVTRDIAARLAFASGQIKEKTEILCSEDLWHERHGGRFMYDSIRGYYE